MMRRVDGERSILETELVGLKLAPLRKGEGGGGMRVDIKNVNNRLTLEAP
jgi:hypothetical protein